ncbi:hypothetical protein DMA11_06165 [Marinilabiliaceae bacterium JC017]|nr:hypothetical protein DMA11_06165 [Marinilabiliaceae bacterium JC017]
MEIINLPRLRVKELQTLSENSLSICDGITELKPAIDLVQTTLNAFKRGMLKEQASAANKKELDADRAIYISCFFKNVSAEKHDPTLIPEVRETLERMCQITDKYGTKITRLSYNEETAAVDNLLTELKQIDTQAIDKGVMRWIPLIEKANNDFKAANDAYIAERAKADSIESATSLAPTLQHALEELFTQMFAHAKLSTNEPIRIAYAELETLVKSFN